MSPSIRNEKDTSNPSSSSLAKPPLPPNNDDDEAIQLSNSSQQQQLGCRRGTTKPQPQDNKAATTRAVNRIAVVILILLLLVVASNSQSRSAATLSSSSGLVASDSKEPQGNNDGHHVVQLSSTGELESLSLPTSSTPVPDASVEDVLGNTLALTNSDVVPAPTVDSDVSERETLDSGSSTFAPPPPPRRHNTATRTSPPQTRHTPSQQQQRDRRAATTGDDGEEIITDVLSAGNKGRNADNVRTSRATTRHQPSVPGQQQRRPSRPSGSDARNQQYTAIVHTTCQCKQPFIEQYEAMYKEGLANLAATPTVTPQPTSSEPPTPEPTTPEPTTMEPTTQAQEDQKISELVDQDQPTTQPGKVALTAKWRRSAKLPNQMPPNIRQQVRQPYNHNRQQSGGSRAKHPAASPPVFLPFWKPGSYGHSGSLRRFLKRWYREVMVHREKTLAGDAPSSPPPEARILLIGDSLSRNLHLSLLNQALDEGLGPEDDLFSIHSRHALATPMTDNYQAMFVTWPGPKSGRADAQYNYTAVIKIRYETAMYFGMDTHSIKSSRGLEFNPTHVFIGRGMWDVIHGRPRDPATALSGFSAGLVRLRKELSEHRRKLTPAERKLYPPTRVVYWGLPKMFQSWEPGAKAQHCGFDQEQNYFRDALYAAVRRANGALQHMHSKERFDSVAIELFDYYAMSMAAGAVNTKNGDCVHPAATPRLAIISQMLDLVSQPTRSQESVQQLVDEAQANNRVFLNATMYVPPPLVVRESDELTNTTCPLSLTLDDVDRILHPPKLVGVGAAAALSEDVEDLTPPPLQSIPTSTGKELFFSMMRCQVTDNMNWGTVRPVIAARVGLDTAVNKEAAPIGGDDNGPPPAAATSRNSFEMDQRRSDYVSACSAMLFSALMGHRTTLPFYTHAKKVPYLRSKASGPELLWAGNRCLQFINREAATLGPEAFFQQLWGYTERHRMICAVVPLVSWLLRQPAHEGLNGGLDGGDELARCALRGQGGLRMKN